MKKIISLILAVCMLLTVAYAADTQGHWATEEIKWAKEMGVMNGYPDGTFKPDDFITRAEALKTVTVLFNVTSEEKTFDDVKETDWHYTYIKDGHSVMPPISGNTFNPDKEITRQDAIYAIVKAKFGEVSSDESVITYKDAYKIADYAKTAIAFAKEKEIAIGYEDGTIRPDIPLTRAEFAKLLKVSYETVVEEELPQPEVPEVEEEKVLVSNFIPVSSVSLSINDNGNEVMKIDGLKTEKDVTFLSTESFDTEVKRGDTIIPVFNNKNFVKSVKILATYDGSTVNFGTEYMTEVNTTSNKSKYYFGEIENIERNMVTLKDNAKSVGSFALDFVAKGDAETYFYYTGANQRNNLYIDDKEALEFEDGNIYLGSDQVTTAFVVAREIDGELTEMTIYVIK